MSYYQNYTPEQLIELLDAKEQRAKIDCSLIMETLAGAHICTPEETYGTHTSWAILDLVKAFKKPQEKKEPTGRPTWDQYFIGIMEAVSRRSTCNRGMVGAVLVRRNHILATGYAGAPVGLAHCDQVGHLMRSVTDHRGKTTEHCVRTTHAEANAIVQAAKVGVSTEGATLYCRMEPCLGCTNLILNCGIVRIVCQNKYQAAQDSRHMLESAKIELVVLGDTELTYEDGNASTGESPI